LAKLGFLDEGLSDRQETINYEHHQEVINRIISSYHAAKEEQKKVSLQYQLGGAWKETIETRRSEYIKALNSSDFESLSNLLKNVFRNNGIAGLWTYGYYNDIRNRSNAKRKTYINNILLDYHTAIDFIDHFDISKLAIKPIGNPWGYLIKGTLVLPTAFRHYYYASHVHNLLEDVNTPIVCEIGGGFGGFAYYLLSANKDVKYIDFDLPEVLLIAQYFLMKSFPEKKFLLFGEDECLNISKEIINSYDVILMPNFSLPNVENKSADLVINTGSLSEMDYHTVEEYINQIARITNKYFFHDNSDKPVLNNEGHVEVTSSKFPISNIFKRIYKTNSLWGGGSGRYREHLYQRKECSV